MPIETDHDPVTAAALVAELERFRGQCWYDEARKKIIYRADADALRAYMAFQQEEMEKHNWIESQKAHRDLGNVSLSDWVCRHSAAFAQHWRRTHVFVPPKTTAKEP